MLYTPTSPAEQGDRIRLFPSVAAARAAVGERLLYGVAVHYDVRARRLIPAWADPWAFDPSWTAPAQLHGDGSVTARGPIPAVLFIGRADDVGLMVDVLAVGSRPDPVLGWEAVLQ